MSDVGVIGLGIMGKNLILNLVDRGYTVHVFNRTISKTAEIEKISSKILGFDNLNAFVSSLRSPRKILLIVSAGSPVEEYLRRLSELLNENDIVIDCGNSNYKDTIRRFHQYKFNFVGCGMSGGEQGARYGPSLMIGCKKDAYGQVRSILESISAKHNSNPCCKWLGNDGAGHFVKIVHNGIEYCEMQLLQELLNISPSHEFSLRIFESLHVGRCNGYLVEICEKILRTRNDSGIVLYQINDRAEQKGTGKMCVVAGVETDFDVSFIAQAVFSRYLSNAKDKRVKFNSKVKNMSCHKIIDQSKFSTATENRDVVDIDVFEKAFYLAKALCYIQGANLLMNSKLVHGWNYTISDICDVWRNGCILRCEFLDVLREISKNDIFEISDGFLAILDECLPSLKQLCLFCLENNVYSPLFNNCLTWLYGMNMKAGNGTLLQAMRDYFGGHGVVLINGEEVNIDWNE
ncbi:6-phosphogluconate dehydrogenase, decarboxylating [Vittaforma corneae ATCC 50505]|uniref:6-phosphogluconate dehydrogenase, decarboxylating n=1 Tax=Vittaforma corneae (strain ATCC 50505) TaxID=993615 RepID=L2GLQ4_VITCO|nr:6-phosphogluconate dehydrogenase, decarboxylating [Vittaforma corneae ATCC 50505]ELA41212.1 6-phosphogluconate dehydrogenase, decarboxylating [Vittaforma corneae ATCC 50505]